MNILILNENVSNVKESKAKILSNHCYASKSRLGDFVYAASGNALDLFC